MNNLYISRIELSVYDIYIKKFLLANRGEDFLISEEVSSLWFMFVDGYKRLYDQLDEDGMRANFRVNPKFENTLSVKNHFMLRMKQYREGKFNIDPWTK